MNKKLLAAMVSASFLVAGCAMNDYSKMSAGSGVPEAALAQNCPQIRCSYDKLKDRVEARASDGSMLYALNGMESRTIQYNWVSGSNAIAMDLILTSLYESWAFIDSAEIYVGKEMVAKVNGRVDRVVGSYNDVAGEHEKVETLSTAIDLKTAKRIAEADYHNVTVRFYGKNGYRDVELSREHNLLNVVQLATAS